MENERTIRSSGIALKRSRARTDVQEGPEEDGQSLWMLVWIIGALGVLALILL